jgi:hypothetical protein
LPDTAFAMPGTPGPKVNAASFFDHNRRIGGLSDLNA